MIQLIAEKKVAGVFMDLIKAFDNVSHSKSLNVLNSLGIGERAFSWFNLYLKDRKQYVEIDFVDNFYHLISL